MATIPDSMEHCVYFTRRATPAIGKVIAWVERQQCPKCKKGMMSKPKDEKRVTFKVRSTEYVCEECGYTEEKGEHEAKLTCNIHYTCPKCGHAGETSAPFKRKTFQGVPAIVYACKCGEKFGISKKMKEGKKKNVEVIDDDF